MAPPDPKAAERERQLIALLDVIKVDPAGNIEIKAKGRVVISGSSTVQISTAGADISLSGPIVNINKGALEVL